MAKQKEQEDKQPTADQSVAMPAPQYAVRQYLQSETYKADRDILVALLDEQQLYTPAEVQDVIDRFKTQEAI
ncbi:hypothetical protein ACFOQM_06110 [Paenibacillus sp. GCM10012307]|uniref:Uncharacterized protein n=1 Tax=Paenibacillus roseus TaxID=2798579 RepID=A0A934IX21_9BACL|nr:hypothetical protein [Paenibacillus roseus]MBJ6360872.1 hypothetical protein [Paenibacillus roseus]